jgi:hypothetical protein
MTENQNEPELEKRLDLEEQLEEIGESFNHGSRKKGKKAVDGGKKSTKHLQKRLEEEAQEARLFRHKVDKAEKVITHVLPLLFKDIPLNERGVKMNEVLETHSNWITAALNSNGPIVNRPDLKEVKQETGKITVEHEPTKFRASGENFEKAENELEKGLRGYLQKWKTLDELPVKLSVRGRIDDIIQKYELALA